MARKGIKQVQVEINPYDVFAPPDDVDKINPPVETRQQELPLNNLTWENFERLCFRLAGKGKQVEYWQRYGRQGQAQGGIDIFARLTEGKYDVWQCKRYKIFSASKINAAVDMFLAGEWKERTKRLLLCVTDRLDDTKIQAAIEIQAQRLKSEGIIFLPYGIDRLSEELKSYPDLVDDFFGRVWTKAFCGEDFLVTFSKMRHRLDGVAVSRLRRELLCFYTEFFNTLDRGLIGYTTSSPGPLESPPLLERFVIPDVLIRENIMRSIGSRPTEYPDMDSSVGSPRAGSVEHAEGSSHETPMTSEHILRRSLSEWLAEGGRVAVLGDAGSGKSTLLRCVALDLLSKQLRLPELASVWGQHLPILIPFARWTQMTADQPSGVSLDTMIHTWLQSFSVSSELVELVREALQDRRLLLLVDGLDEWVNETAARTVLSQLETVVKTHGIAAILSGRPLGVEKLGGLGRPWRTGTLAPLTEPQQRQLAYIWFGTPSAALPDTLKSEDTIAKNKIVDWQVDNFFKDLREGGRLHELAGTPLLLTGLILLRIRQVALPRNRFQAYRELTKLLLEIHPQARSSAAAEGSPRFKVLSEPELRERTLGRLAYEVRHQGADNGFPKRDAERIIADFLRDENEVGLSVEQARAGARELLAVNAETSGILIEKAPKEVGFIHAVFEEHLAAIYLAGRPLSEQTEFVVTCCPDPRWRNVILDLFQQLTRPSDIDELITQVEAAPARGVGEVAKRLLLAEAAFSEGKRTARIAKHIAASIFERTETGHWMPEREALLRISLEGFASGSLQDDLHQHLDRWYPETQSSREQLFEALSFWPKEQGLAEVLWRGLFDTERQNRRGAARTLGKIFTGQSDIRENLLIAIRRPLEPQIASAFLEAILLGWPDVKFLEQIIDRARISGNPELKLVGIRAAIARSRHSMEDRTALLRLSHRSNHLYELRNELGEALTIGWPKDSVVFDACWAAWPHHYIGQDEIDRGIAQDVLLRCYAEDERVVTYLCELISSDHLRRSMDTPWDALQTSYSKHPVVGAALDAWLYRQPVQSHYMREVALAAIVSGSEAAKTLLLRSLGTSGRYVFWPVMALIKTWGMQDDEVGQALRGLVDAGPECTQHLAHYLPDIISEKAECRRRLVDIARQSAVARPDFLVEGLSRLGIDHTDSEVVDLVLPLATFDKKLFEPTGKIITQFSGDSRVRRLAVDLLPRRNAPLPAIAWAYRDDPEIRAMILKQATPLPAALRNVIANHAARRCDEFVGLEKVLSTYECEEDATVRTTAEAAYYAAVARRNSDIDGAEAIIVQELHSVGPAMDKLRQSALAGLINLGRFSSFRDLPDRYEKRPLLVSALDSSIHENSVLLELIASQWEKLYSMLGDTIFVRLSSWGGNAIDAWNSLAPHLGVSKSIQADFLEFCSQTDTKLKADSLRALARLQRGSRLLQEHCRRIFEGASKNPNFSPYDDAATQHEAGFIFGTIYSSGNDVRDFLERWVNQKCSGAVIGLCLGWPSSPKLDAIYADLKDKQRVKLTWPAALYVVGVRGDTNNFENILLSFIRQTDGDIWEFSSHCIDAVTRRLAYDDELYDRLFLRLRQDPTLNERTSLPRLLSIARTGDKNLRKWCEEEILRQMHGSVFADSGFDVVAGRVRPTAHALLDVLMPYGPDPATQRY